MSSPISIVAYLLLLAASAFLFGYLALQVGRLVRPAAPEPEKLRPYECGEPAVGSSDVQFDLRFYVVAIVFLVFEVEVAFFFPWAVAYGNLCRGGEAPSLADRVGAAAAVPEAAAPDVAVPRAVGSDAAVPAASVPEAATPDVSPDRSPASRTVATGGGSGSAGVGADARAVGAGTMAPRRAVALAAIVDMAVFFAVLLVGYAYVWSRGDLDWVRAAPHCPRPETIV